MGKHISDQVSQSMKSRKGQAGAAPQVPRVKAQQRNHSQRGK